MSPAAPSVAFVGYDDQYLSVAIELMEPLTGQLSAWSPTGGPFHLPAHFGVLKFE